MSTFSDRLKKRRLLKDWSKSTTAQKLGISAQRYSNWEYGARQPDYDMLNQIANLFGTSVDYLTGRSDNPAPATKQDSSSDDLNTMLDDASSFDGKPINDHDREVIRAYLEGHFDK